MSNSLKSRVERFARALSFGLFDCELEYRHNTLVYFYDADVIFPLIMGFEYEDIDKSDNRLCLVRALLSCGSLGQFCMLRPHALELSDKLKRQRQATDLHTQSFILAKAQQFLNTKGISNIMTRLNSIAVGRGEYRNIREAERAKLFIDILSQCAGESFAYIEQING